MQISLTVGIPENERRRKISDNTKNPEMTERLRSARAQIKLNHRDVLGNTSAWNWKLIIQGINKNRQMMENINVQKLNKNKTGNFQTVTCVCDCV